MTIVEGIKIIGTSEHAEQYPMLSDEEIQSLADDIAENGLFDPITVTSNGILLDGRNRLRACELAGVEPRIDIYDGDEEQIGAFVRSKNRRRHQPTGSRAMSEALSMKIDGKRKDGRWVHGSLPDQESGGSAAFSRRLREAGFVIDFAPGLADQVVSGDLALDAAFKQAEQRRDAERQKLEQQKRLEAEEADSRAFVEENAPDLAAQVGDVFQSYVEAHDVWKRRNREEAERIRREEREQREREAAERRNDEEQSRMIGSLLEQVSFLEYETQRAWCIEATGKYPEVLPSNHKKLHTPSRIRELAEAINTYATELENSYARTT